MGCLKGNKAGGKNGVLPERLKICGFNRIEYICEVFGAVWGEQRVLSDWKDLVPIPKNKEI